MLCKFSRWSYSWWSQSIRSEHCFFRKVSIEGVLDRIESSSYSVSMNFTASRGPWLQVTNLALHSSQHFIRVDISDRETDLPTPNTCRDGMVHCFPSTILVLVLTIACTGCGGCTPGISHIERKARRAISGKRIDAGTSPDCRDTSWRPLPC
jgi:hypothetical protein